MKTFQIREEVPAMVYRTITIKGKDAEDALNRYMENTTHEYTVDEETSVAWDDAQTIDVSEVPEEQEDQSVIDDETRAIYGFYQGTRKPGTFDEVDCIIHFNNLSAKDKAAFRKLDFFYAETEGITTPFDNIGPILADTQYFILQKGSDLYFVDTQGYEYCRYVAKIVNFEGQLPLFFPM